MLYLKHLALIKYGLSPTAEKESKLIENFDSFMVWNSLLMQFYFVFVP